MNNENPVNGQPVVDTTSNVVGAQPVQQPVMEPMQPQQPQPQYQAPQGQYQQYQAPQGQYQAPVNQYQPQGQYQMYQAPQQPYQQQYQSQYQYRQPSPSVPGNGFCIASLVLGLCSLFFWWLPWINLVIIVLAIIFGIVGLTKKHSDGKAIAGIIVAGLVAIPTIIILVSYAAIGSIFSWFSTNTNTYRNYNYSYNRNRYDLEDVIDSIFD